MIERNIHHTGNPPSRTCITKPVNNTYTGKWCATFERFRGEPGAEHKVGRVTSAPLFLTEADAMAAADRAMDELQRKGLFPNMCEMF